MPPKKELYTAKELVFTMTQQEIYNYKRSYPGISVLWSICIVV